MKHLDFKSTGQRLAMGVLCVFAAMLLSGYPQCAVAQTSSKMTVSGTVIDARTKQPIVGASIYVKDGTVGVTSGLDGTYQLSYVSGKTEVLVCSFIGYDQQERIVGSSTVIDFALVESAQQIGDVVVVAFGKQKEPHWKESRCPICPN